MTPAARLSAVQEILGAWQQEDIPADRVVETWGRNHRFAGSKDRAAIAERVFATFRRRRDIAEYMGSDDPRALVIGGLRVIDGLAPAELGGYFGGTYGLPILTDAETIQLARPVPAIGRNLPDWIEPMVEASLGPRLDAECATLLSRAPVDLRVNRLKATREEARGRLALQGIATSLCARAPDGLRLEKPVRLDHLDLMQDGWIEPQDEASQIVSRLIDARPGQRVLDLCAGAGGKSLALAAIMNNSGEIWAADIDPRRLERLDPRSYRAGARIIRISSPQGLYHRVVVDAPCSGSGTWRRAPDARWRLTPQRLDRWQASQKSLLRRAADLVEPGGRLIYITCSWLTAENQDPVMAFLGERSDYRALDWRTIYQDTIGLPVPDGDDSGPFLTLSTAQHGTDGFFVAILGRDGQTG